MMADLTIDPDVVPIFDFDGTCTTPKDGAREAFIDAHQAGLAKLLGQPPEWALVRYAAAREKIVANPDEYGWRIRGKIVASALADAFVEAQTCAQLILEELGEDLTAWAERMNDLYQAHYLKYEMDFRPEMLEAFNMLRSHEVPFYIVTNSDPVKVQKRLGVLGDDAAWIGPLVLGHAKKFDWTDGPESIREEMFFPGLRRPVQLRKQHYHDVLTRIMKTHAISWDKLLVIGDNAELDDAMPVECGADGCLILGPDTPPYEKHWAEEHPRVRLITDLREAFAP